MKTLDKKLKSKTPLFPKPVDPKDTKKVNQWADEMIKYGKSISPELGDKKAINQYAQRMIKSSERKILRDMPWITYMVPEKRYQ